MSNREAYLSDLDELKQEIDKLLQLVSEGKTKREKETRTKAEQIAGLAWEKALIACMGIGYIPLE